MTTLLIEETVDISRYGNSANSIEKVLKDHGATDKVFLVSEQIDFTESFSIGKNVMLRFTPAGVFNIDAGCKVVIEGPIEAGLWRIFAGDGTVDLKQIEVVYPQWWGAVGDDDADDWWAIQKAIDTCRPVVVTKGTFRIGSTLKIPKECPEVDSRQPSNTVTKPGLHITGTDKHESILRTSRPMPMIELGNSTSTTIRNLTLHNSATYWDMKDAVHLFPVSPSCIEELAKLDVGSTLHEQPKTFPVPLCLRQHFADYMASSEGQMHPISLGRDDQIFGDPPERRWVIVNPRGGKKFSIKKETDAWHVYTNEGVTFIIVRDVAVETGANNVLIEDCVLDGGHHAIRPISRSQRWAINRCEFRNQKFAGIMNGASHLTITNSEFRCVGEDTDDDTSMSDGQAHHTHPIYINALDDETIRHFTITNNLFEDNASDAVHIITGSQNAVIEDVVITNNTFARNCSYQNFSKTDTRLRPDIIIGTTSSANEHSAVSKVVISNNVFAAPARIPPVKISTTEDSSEIVTKDWERRAAIQAVGNCREIVVDGNVAHGYNQFMHVYDSAASGKRNYGMGPLLITNNVANLNHMFSFKSNTIAEDPMLPSLYEEFEKYGQPLGDSAQVQMVNEPEKYWKIVDQGRRYIIREENGKLEVYNDTVVRRSSGSAVSYSCCRGKGINISHNHFSNAKSNGIFLQGSNLAPCKIHGNTLVNCGEPEVDEANGSIYLANDIRNIDIEDNLIIGGAEYGIRLDSACGSNVVRNNTIRAASKRGILLSSGSDDVIVESNTIAGSIVGIDVETRNNIIRSNIISDMHEFGIWLHSTCSNVVVNSNIICQGKHGIRIDSSHNIIRDNTVCNTSAPAIRLSQGSRNNVLLHNLCKDTASGIQPDTQEEQENNTIVQNFC